MVNQQTLVVKNFDTLDFFMGWTWTEVMVKSRKWQEGEGNFYICHIYQKLISENIAWLKKKN
jgi:hypothetical protein